MLDSILYDLQYKVLPSILAVLVACGILAMLGFEVLLLTHWANTARIMDGGFKGNALTALWFIVVFMAMLLTLDGLIDLVKKIVANSKPYQLKAQ